MAYNYQKDFQPMLFSTFKPIPENKDVACSYKTCQEETSLPTNMAAVAKNKNTDTSSAIFVQEATRSTGATLKHQTYQWFERTQRMRLLKNGRFPDWFHGFITRTGTERCRHFMINHPEDKRYVIEGEKSVHLSLEELVNHYCMFPVEPYKEMLTMACPMVEYASSSSAVKVPSFLRKDPIQSPQDLDPLIVYAPVKKPSGDHKRNEEESCSVKPNHIPSEESHTYTVPILWNQPRVECSNNVSEPIAFYAVGRGSCKDNLENVYSEVDINAIPSSQSREANNRHTGLSTLPHPAPKAIKTKSTAFHASFHSHKHDAIPQEEARRGHFSRSNIKPHAIQLDDPTYGKGHLQHAGLSGLYEENVYEKIPENSVEQLKDNKQKKKVR
ncbi:SH2 domain-containing protein 2A isoform X2 [Hyla sarda]|uniref:SH2 domain-containing protein 2A isoform X2 n=1 Tax=Hyla sarda TaxID=327740 RepID=UPI0024C3B5EC|nr:SH2 domain-containing protein 2A isoform X2 [Hyla sarda]